MTLRKLRPEKPRLPLIDIPSCEREVEIRTKIVEQNEANLAYIEARHRVGGEYLRVDWDAVTRFNEAANAVATDRSLPADLLVLLDVERRYRRRPRA